MVSIHFESGLEDAPRRERIYAGDVFVYGPRPGSSALCALARRMAAEAFAPLDPRDAQHELPVERYAAILAELKPRFMHHPRVKELIPAILREFGCRLEDTYFDIPRLRTMTHGGYLTSGIALAVPPHRDTWYGGSQTQLNWWFALHELTPECAMALHPGYFDRGVLNTSAVYDHRAWLGGARQEAARHLKSDTRAHPECREEVETHHEVRVLCPADGLILFSASHLHATVPNTSGRTRLSVDFRSVHLPDLRAGRGAPNVDCEAAGTTLGEYRRASDLSPPPDDAVATLDRRAQPEAPRVSR
jgi:hypothetical protein